VAIISAPWRRTPADTALDAGSVAKPTSASVVLAIVASGYLLASWAMNPVSSILPTITRDLQIDVTRAGWLMNAYFLLLVGWVLIAGRVGDALGHGKVFRMGCLLFGAGSLIAAISDGFVPLVVARAVQGLGSAMLFGTSLAIIAGAFSGSRLAWAVGSLSVAGGISSLAGTWLSTTLVQVGNWHLTFVAPLVIALLVAACAGKLPSVRRSSIGAIDWLGGMLLSAALTFMLIGLNHLHEGPETFEAGAPYHLGMHAVALAFFVLFLWRQVRAPRPLVELRLLRSGRLSAGIVTNGIAHSSMLATSLLIPFLLEGGRGYSPTETQELMLAMQLSLICASLAGGWLYARWPSSAMGVLSLGAIACGLLVLGRIGAMLPFGSLFPVVAVLGAGLGIFTAVNNTSVMTGVRAEQRGFASGMVETTRQLGHSLGVSISSGVLQATLAAAAVPALGYRDGFSQAALTMGLVSSVGVLLVLYPSLRGRRPRPVMTGPRSRPTG
jgi:MFS family permease